MNINEVNILALAYLGDSVYELRVRNYLINKKIYKVNNLQTKSLNYVTAKNQCKFINYLLDNDYVISLPELFEGTIIYLHNVLIKFIDGINIIAIWETE